MKIVELKGVSKSFKTPSGGVAEAVNDVSFDVEEAEFVCLFGPSGCGKTTILRMVAGFEFPTSGECLFKGSRVRRPGPDRGMVFQDLALFPWMNVTKNLMFALECARKLKGAPARKIVASTLSQLGLENFADYYIKDLSGGMRQRVAIGRLLAVDSEVLLMDEPFSALDALTRSDMQAELLRLCALKGSTVMFVTHNVEEAVVLADRVLVFGSRPGHLVADVRVDLPRPRDVTAERFNEVKRQVMDSLSGVEGTTIPLARHEEPLAPQLQPKNATA